MGAYGQHDLRVTLPPRWTEWETYIDTFMTMNFCNLIYGICFILWQEKTKLWVTPWWEKCFVMREFSGEGPYWFKLIGRWPWLKYQCLTTMSYKRPSLNTHNFDPWCGLASAAANCTGFNPCVWRTGNKGYCGHRGKKLDSRNSTNIYFTW